MSSIDIEVQKLKDASKQIKYRLEKLDHKQKKIPFEGNSGGDAGS